VPDRKTHWYDWLLIGTLAGPRPVDRAPPFLSWIKVTLALLRSALTSLFPLRGFNSWQKQG
jgi:hypothetical protein